MHREIKAIIDDEVRVLVLTDHEYGRVIHRSRNSPRKQISSFHQFLLDITRILRCPENNSKQLSGLIREVNRYYDAALRDGVVSNREQIKLIDLFESAIALMESGLTHQNPEKCYLAYATSLALRDKPMTQSQIVKQAKKDGFEDPEFVVFLYNNAFVDTKSNPRRSSLPGRNLGYGSKNGAMAKSQLRTIKRTSIELHDAIRDADELPDWVLSKVTVAMDRLTVAKDYILSKLRKMELEKQGYKMNPMQGSDHHLDTSMEIEDAKQLLKQIHLAMMEKSIEKLDRLVYVYSDLINTTDVQKMKRLTSQLVRKLSNGQPDLRLLAKAKELTSQFYVQDEEFSSEDSWEEDISSEDI